MVLLGVIVLLQIYSMDPYRLLQMMISELEHEDGITQKEIIALLIKDEKLKAALAGNGNGGRRLH